jgi:hypothetical protein
MQKTDLNIRSSYKRYSKEVETPVEINDFISIANGYMEFLMQKVREGEEVTMPARIGTLFIQGTKKNLKFNKDGIPLLPPNWGETKKLWDRNPDAKATKKIVYCLNEETNGVVYKVNWSKNRVPIENKIYYNLILTRDNKRAIHNRIKQGKEYLIKSE